jgi:hypothetical protein
MQRHSTTFLEPTSFDLFLGFTVSLVPPKDPVVSFCWFIETPKGMQQVKIKIKGQLFVHFCSPVPRNRPAYPPGRACRGSARYTECRRYPWLRTAAVVTSRSAAIGIHTPCCCTLVLRTKRISMSAPALGFVIQVNTQTFIHHPELTGVVEWKRVQRWTVVERGRSVWTRDKPFRSRVLANLYILSISLTVCPPNRRMWLVLMCSVKL